MKTLPQRWRQRITFRARWIRFVVGKDGSVSRVEVLQGIDRVCDEEAVRVVKSMPKWIPGRHNGRAVPVVYTVPIVFKLQ
jgi:protein TonB